MLHFRVLCVSIFVRRDIVYYFYKKYLWLYYILAIPGEFIIIFTFAAAAKYNHQGLLLLADCLISIFLVVYLAACVANVFAFKHFNKTLLHLYTELDPQKFLEEYEPDFEKFAASRFKKRIIPYAYYIEALKESGQIKKALAVYSSVADSPQFKKPSLSAIAANIYANLWSALHGVGETDGERLFKEKYLAISETAKKQKRIKAVGADINCAFLRGEYGKVIELAEKQLADPKNLNMSKLRLHCRIADAYAILGDADKAHEQLNAAKEISSTVFTYTSAKALVEKILQSEN